MSGLVVALRAFQPTNVSYFKVFLTGLLMQAQQFVVVLVVFGCHIGFAVAVNTPAHGQARTLLNNLHLLHLTVALLALQAPYIGMLGVVKIGQIRQVVYPYPFNRFITGSSLIKFFDFRRTRLNGIMAVPANVYRRDPRLFAFLDARMAITAVNLVFTGMKLV